MIELQKKVHRRIYVRDITFLTARSPFYDFLLLSSSTLTPFPNDAMGGILCDAMGDMLCVMISWVNGRKYVNLLQFNTTRFFDKQPFFQLTLSVA